MPLTNKVSSSSSSSNLPNKNSCGFDGLSTTILKSIKGIIIGGSFGDALGTAGKNLFFITHTRVGGVRSTGGSRGGVAGVATPPPLNFQKRGVTSVAVVISTVSTVSEQERNAQAWRWEVNPRPSGHYAARRLKLKFSQYSSIHTNYIIPHCTTLQYNHNI